MPESTADARAELVLAYEYQPGSVGGAVIGVTGSDEVVTGIVVVGTVEVEVSGAAFDVGTSVTCTVVGVSTSDGALDEQAARIPMLKDASRTGASTRVFIPLACLSNKPTHALYGL